MEGLNLAIANVLGHDSINGKVEITSWTPGSFWLKLALGSELAFFMIGDITCSAAVVLENLRRAMVYSNR